MNKKTVLDCSLYRNSKCLGKPPVFELLHINLSVREVMCAYVLGKMVGIASFWRKRIQFHNFSTLPCGFEGRNLMRTNFSRKRFGHFS